MPSARSCPAGFWSSPSVAMMSRMSSRIWNTMPKQRPNSVQASTSAAGSPPVRAPIRQEVAMSEAVLPAMAVEVFVLGPGDLEGGADLGDLPLAELAQRVGQEPGDLGAQTGGDLGRAGQQEVAGHDGHQVPEPAVDALDIAPDGGLVHDVVVVQRGQVDQLDGHPAEKVLLGGIRRPAVAVARARTGRSRFPPAAMRWVVTSSRKPSPVTTDSVSRGSRRFSPRAIGEGPGPPTVHSYRR